MTTAEAPTHRDRSTRLVVFGLVAAAFGVVAVLLALLQLSLLLPAADELLPSGVELAAEPARVVMGSVTWALLGGAFISVGIGSVRRRRWARPLMLALTWSWLLCGAASLLLLPALLDMSLASSGLETSPALTSIVRWFMLALVFVFGVLLPATFVWVYSDRELQRTCEALDRRAAWTDRRPAPVIGLAVALAGCGVLLVPMALKPAVPLFGWLVTGVTGAVLMLAAAAGCCVLALEVNRASPAGWWGTTISMVLLGGSMLVTQALAPAGDWYAALGYPMPEAPVGSGPFGGTAAMAATAVLTVASVVYMLRIRKHFAR